MVRVGGGAIVLRPGEGRRIDIGDFDVQVYVEPATTGELSLIETTEFEVNLGPPMHIHRDCAESFYVLAGSYVMYVDDEAFACEPGSFLYIPPGVRHTFMNEVANSRKLNLYTPAGMVGYFDELAAGLSAGMDEADLDAIASRYEMEVVGPVPESYLTDQMTPD